ncbi:MAG: hypothetical protein JSV85_01280 [Candidatus Bathyarchaeota archaeon]|nr:MAG: hypothetical protein JSV85_01280 [Candidatus Bathyarchaeota archaeon]
MFLDVSLPLALFLITASTLFFYTRIGKKLKSLLGGKELTTGHTVLLVVAMGAMVTILGWTIIQIPDMAIMVLFLYAYSMVLFLFTFLVVPESYSGFARTQLAVLVPALFIGVYALFRHTYLWELYLLNFFAVVFAISISVYMGGLFSWKTTAIFVVLLTFMDLIQVFVTRFMVESSRRMVALQLPVMIIVPTFPSEGYILLGLGDIFLSGLLSIQTVQKYGRRFGFASVLTIALVFLLLETFLINSNFEFFPATVLVVSGWLVALGARYFHKSFL